MDMVILLLSFTCGLQLVHATRVLRDLSSEQRIDFRIDDPPPLKVSTPWLSHRRGDDSTRLAGLLLALNPIVRGHHAARHAAVNAISSPSMVASAVASPVFLNPHEQPRRAKGTMTQLTNELDYRKKILDATLANKVTVITFFANWCRACKATKPQIERMVNDFPNIEFCAIPFEDNKALAKEIGIKALPYVVIVGGKAGEVESFQCGRSKVPLLMEKLENLSEDIPDVVAFDASGQDFHLELNSLQDEREVAHA